jgi:hypothetical protein
MTESNALRRSIKHSPVLLGQKHRSCLLYADELVLLSESQEGLQNCLNKTWEYCKSWGLQINYAMSKVMIFNKGSRLSNIGKKIK